MRSVTRIEGMEDVNKNLRKALKGVEADTVEPILLEQAQIVADDARNRAPLGPTGNLKRSVVAKVLKRRGDEPAPALAGIDYRIGPHAHLVEFGTVKTSPHPFFRPAWDAHKSKIGDAVARKIGKRIEESV